MKKSTTKKYNSVKDALMVLPEAMNMDSCYALIDYDSAEQLKADLQHLFLLVMPKNSDSAANIFCHNISDDKCNDIGETGEMIMQDGLACDYSTIFRTMTYMKADTCNISEQTINNIFDYSYVNTNYLDRVTIVSAIPKLIKDVDGSKINFSTPDVDMLQKPWSNRPYVAYDKIKQRKINKEFMLCSMHINDEDKRYSLKINLKNFIYMTAKMKEKFKQKYLSELKGLQYST